MTNINDITPVWKLPRWYKKHLLVESMETIFSEGKKHRVATVYDDEENERFTVKAMNRTWKDIEAGDNIEVIKDPIGDCRNSKLIIIWVRNEDFP